MLQERHGKLKNITIPRDINMIDPISTYPVKFAAIRFHTVMGIADGIQKCIESGDSPKI